MTDNISDLDDTLQAIIFAGPNGSGKTSLITAIKDSGLTAFGEVHPVPEYFINPDQVSKDLQGNFPDQKARDIAAFDVAIKMRNAAIESKKSFAFETVLSHPSRINEMLRLKEQGYTLLLTFITTDNPDTNVARVKQRVATGTTTGHDVPEKTVRDRYERTLKLLPKAAEVVDAVFVYDNSIDFQAPTLQAAIERDQKFEIAPEAKEWVHVRLVEPLQQRETELATIIDALESKHQPASFAYELQGTYSGPVIVATKNYMVQYDEVAKQSVIHDRLMLDTATESHKDKAPTYTPNERLTVQYTHANAPKIERQERSLLPEAGKEISVAPKTKAPVDDRER